MTSWTPGEADVVQAGDRTLISVTGSSLVEAGMRAIHTVEQTYPVYGEVGGEADLAVITIIQMVDDATNRLKWLAQVNVPTPLLAF
jgi:hypothetical protein